MHPNAPNWVEIDYEALRHNAQRVKASLQAGCELWAVVKANAYGHGAVVVAHSLTKAPSAVSRLIVASLNEAIELREAGIRLPILMLCPPMTLEEWQEALAHEIEVVIESIEGYQQARMLASKAERALYAHLEIDTGMSRLGILPEDIPTFLEHWDPRAPIRWQGVFTHFAKAESDPELTQFQRQSLLQSVEWLCSAGFPEVARHASASAGLLNYPESHLDAVRCGLLLYGIAPSGLEAHPLCQVLRPVLSWKARVISVRTIPKGRGVSYGWRFRAERPTRVATLSVGYADGYPIGLTNRAEVVLHGVRVPQIGRICMDMMMVDVSAVPQTQPGDVAVLIGSEGTASVRIEELAKWLPTTPHEIPTRLGTRPIRYVP